MPVKKGTYNGNPLCKVDSTVWLPAQYFFHIGQSLSKVKVYKNYDKKINRATSTGVSYLRLSLVNVAVKGKIIPGPNAVFIYKH